MNITEDLLKKYYLDDNLSQDAVAELFQCSRGNIQFYLNKYKIFKEKGKTPSKEWLEEQYLALNKSQEEIAKLWGCTRKNISYFIQKYNLQKSTEQVDQQKKNNYFIKTGYTHQAQNPDILKKIRTSSDNKSEDEKLKIKEKRIETNIEKFGYSTPLLNKKVKEKTKKTNLEKYGTEHHFQNEDIKEKIKDTIMENYGVSHQMLNAEVKDKIKQTNIERYGFENPAQNPEIKLKQRRIGIENGHITLYFGKTLNEWSKEYGLTIDSLYHSSIIKKPNLTQDEFISYLENYQYYITDIEVMIKQKLNLEKYNKKFDAVNYPDLTYLPDFKLNDKIALNADGLYWHCDLTKNNNYHYQMRKDYEDLGLKIFQFRADEIENKLDIIKSITNNALGKTSFKISARKTVLKNVPEQDAEEFLNKNHMQGFKISEHVGLYYNDELISIMSFTMQDEKLFIERFCTELNTSVMGGFSKLLNYISLKNNPKVICCLVDLRYGTGDFLLNHGFVIEEEFLNWNWTDYIKVFDKNLFNDEYAEKLGWRRIYDAGQRLYIKNNIG